MVDVTKRREKRRRGRRPARGGRRGVTCGRIRDCRARRNDLTDVEAATLPCAGVTAWHAVVTDGRVKAGTRSSSKERAAFRCSHCNSRKCMAPASWHVEQRGEIGSARGHGSRNRNQLQGNLRMGRQCARLTDNFGVDHVVEVGGAGTLPQPRPPARHTTTSTTSATTTTSTSSGGLEKHDPVPVEGAQTPDSNGSRRRRPIPQSILGTKFEPAQAEALPKPPGCGSRFALTGTGTVGPVFTGESLDGLGITYVGALRA